MKKENIQQQIEKKLMPSYIEVTDESGKHAGHVGWKETGGTHFAVKVVSSMFEGMPLLKRHRQVYEALRIEREKGIHALAIEAMTPKEWEQKKESV